MHLDDEVLARLIDHELPTAAAAAARAHLEQCGTCRARHREAERDAGEVVTQLRALDEPAPVVRATAVAARARRAVPWSLVRRWATGLALAAGLGGVAYALPGSPFRAF